MKVVVTGAAGAVGRRVCHHVAARVDGVQVTGLDRSAGRRGDVIEVDLERDDLVEHLQNADALVHLASLLRAADDDPADAARDVAMAARVLEAAGAAGVGHVVVVSTAMVYGAWPDNPTPLTEDASVRPNPGFLFATTRAEIEQLAHAWRTEQFGRILSTLRPAVTVAEDRPSELAAILRASTAIRTDEGDAPSQFLHADDLASAVMTVVDQQVDGVVNVAPDAWIPPADAEALAGPQPRIRLPAATARAVAALRWRLGAPTPPAVMPYVTYPWVVANDRLRSLGWTATYSNEEAYVVGHEPGPLDMISARRRQEIALGLAGSALAGAAGAGAWLISRARRG